VNALVVPLRPLAKRNALTLLSDKATAVLTAVALSFQNFLLTNRQQLFTLKVNRIFLKTKEVSLVCRGGLSGALQEGLVSGLRAQATLTIRREVRERPMQSLAFEARWAYWKELIEERLRQAAAQSHPVSLYEPIRYTLEGGGKRLRPILLLLASAAVGGRLERCLDAAVAVELLHNFTLVHDDIMDQDDTRRGRPSVHVRWDADVALLAGDALLVLAYQQLAKTGSEELPRLFGLFSAGTLDICEGQALDREFETAAVVTLDDYFHMIEKKTARLLALSCEMGAILGGGSETQVRALREFGGLLGRAFQVQDDLLDLIAEEKTLGKTIGSDLAQKKRTFLLVHALSAASPSQRDRIEAILALPSIGASEVSAMRAIFEETGSLQAAQQSVEGTIRKAREQLARLPASQARDDLEALLLKVLKRNA
jgi:geranylgeranyl diphosphate synthase type II